MTFAKICWQIKNKDPSFNGETLNIINKCAERKAIKQIPRFIDHDNDHLTPLVERIVTIKCGHLNNREIVELVRDITKYKLSVDLGRFRIAKWLLVNSRNTPDTQKELTQEPDCLLDDEGKEKNFGYEAVRRNLISGLSAVILEKFFRMLFFE